MTVRTSRLMPHEQRKNWGAGRGRRTVLCLLALAVLRVVVAPQTSFAQQHARPIPGKVVLIRGAFTVFSLGLDTLADKLRRTGLDAQVVPGMSSGSIVDQVYAEHRRNPNSGPLILIGHSRGAELAADRARDLMRHRIAVDLIVVVDATHRMSVPANVIRCINFYETNRLGVVYGKKVSRENPRTKLLNININQLPGRKEAGYIDHFNIDASDWLHGVIIKAVVRTCHEAEAQYAARAQQPGAAHSRSKNSPPTRPDTPRQQPTGPTQAKPNPPTPAAATARADIITPRKNYMELRR